MKIWLWLSEMYILTNKLLFWDTLHLIKVSKDSFYPSRLSWVSIITIPFPHWTKTLASIAYWDTKDLPHTITTFCPTIHSKYKYRYQSPHYITQQIQIRVTKIPDINTVHCAATHNPEQKWIILSFTAQQCPSFDAEMKWLSEICLSFIRTLESLHFLHTKRNWKYKYK